MTRDKIIVKTAITGIAVNVMLVIFKALVGLMANSIAIILDAVNNLSDALSSIITIVGTKLAMKPADKKHPLGHGRIEYLTAMLIAGIVLFAGVTALIEAGKKILHPAVTHYSVITLIVVAVAIVTKLLLGSYTKKKGQEVDSGALKASGADALFDAVVSAATLFGAAVNMIWGLNIDGWLGAVISVVIIKAGIEMLSETLDHILGKRVDSKLSQELKAEIRSFDGVLGAYDLYLENYGPQRMIGSAHIEIYDTMSAKDIHELTRNLTIYIYKKYSIYLTFGIYAVNTQDDDVIRLRNEFTSYALSLNGALQTHGFYIDKTSGTVTFDVVIAFGISRELFRQELLAGLSNMHPEYQYQIQLDIDYSD
jgi:cation diffusion facilitator family transporter